MRPRLVIPPVLHVVAVALSACGNTPAPPADVAPADVAADAATDACVLPDADPFGPQPGFACARAADAGASVQCSERRVCVRSECGSGCEACEATLFCIPDTLPDGGRPDGCAQNVTCDPDACGAGCRAVG